MNDKQIAEESELMTVNAETVDDSALSQEINNMSGADRLAAAKSMHAISAGQRRPDSNLPDISLTSDELGQTPSWADLPMVKHDSAGNFKDDRTRHLGRAGDNSFDVGRVDRVAPELATDEAGHITFFRLPDGNHVQIEYDDNGSPSTVITGAAVIEKHKDGSWRDKETEQKALEYVSVAKDNSVTIRGGGGKEVKLGPDGHYETRNYSANVAVEEITPDGTAYKRTLNDQYKVGSETKYDPASHIAETRSNPGTSAEAVTGYEIRDDHNRVTDVRVTGGGAEVTRAGKTESFTSITRDGDNLKLTASDKSTLEINKDGTWIRRDKAGKVTEVINSDSEVTTLERQGGKTTATVTDAQGNVVESKRAVKKIDDKDGSYTVSLDKDHKVKRLADGTEEALDGKNKHTESRADRLVSQVKELTPEQQKDLKQDLADIDKLSPEKRERVYASLERIAANDPANPMSMTPEQSRELVTSLAHQVAHPESIMQGNKPTCSLAATEQLMASTHPDAYAEMVASLACDGEYYTNSGRYIEAQGHEYFQHDGKSDSAGQRSFASELFQNAAANITLEPPKQYVSYAPWDPRIQPRPEGMTPANDWGERVIDISNPSKPPEEFFGAKTAEGQAQLLREIMPDGDYRPREITTEAELAQAWEDNGGKPMSIAVFTDQAAFLGMSKNSAAGSASHAVTITHVDKSTGLVYFENSAGGTDHSWPNGKGVPASEFVKSMESKDKTFRHKAIVNQQCTR